MQIVQRTTWMRYLIIGISLTLIYSISSCDDQEEHDLIVEFGFINTTGENIKFNVYIDTARQIQLGAKESTEVFRFKARAGFKNPNTSTCCEGVLDDTFGSSGKFYLINDTECVVHDDEKSDVIGNYQSQVISDRVFRYTYTFTEEDFTDRRNCQ